jgi:hypothetical protein
VSWAAVLAAQSAPGCHGTASTAVTTLAASWLPSHNVSRSSVNPAMARQRLSGPSCTLPRRVCRLLWAPQAPEHFLSVTNCQASARCSYHLSIMMSITCLPRVNHDVYIDLGHRRVIDITSTPPSHHDPPPRHLSIPGVCMPRTRSRPCMQQRHILPLPVPTNAAECVAAQLAPQGPAAPPRPRPSSSSGPLQPAWLPAWPLRRPPD